MQVTIESVSQIPICVVEFDAEYHSDDGTAIQSAGDALAGDAITAAHPNVIIDLTGTKYFGSSFVGLLFALRRRVIDLGGQLAACGVNEDCVSVLNVTRFTDSCPVFDSRSQAIESFV